ncbi:MAG: hypothetical protein HYS86_01360 [Candidatus Chisholmbacteria bacterium]|nr:hypothetical protein [Candidatus Chisholmbacteria bacterium]
MRPQDGTTRSLEPGETVADRFNAAAAAARAIQPDPPNATPGKVTAHPGSDSRR